MKQKSMLKPILLAGALVLLLAGAGFAYNALQKRYTPPQSSLGSSSQNSSPKAAPDFTVQTLDGESVKLSSFKGKPTIVNFWASWCGPCKMEMPDFEALYKQYGDQVNFVMVNLTDGMRESVDVADSFIKQQGYTFPVYFDTEQEAAYTYGINSIPMTYVLDKEGNFYGVQKGVIQKQAVEDAILALLK